MSNEQHNEIVFKVAQKCLAGLLSGPNFNVLLVNAMQGGERVTLGQIVINEAWDMAECLVSKYEALLASQAVKEAA